MVPCIHNSKLLLFSLVTVRELEVQHEGSEIEHIHHPLQVLPLVAPEGYR